eukprot:UN06443
MWRKFVFEVKIHYKMLEKCVFFMHVIGHIANTTEICRNLSFSLRTKRSRLPRRESIISDLLYAKSLLYTYSKLCFLGF